MDLVSPLRSINLPTAKEQFFYSSSINHRDDSGATELNYSAANNDFNLTERLIENGADPNLPNNCGWTPLMTAAFYGNYKIMQVLLKHGANPHGYNKLGITALTIAACRGFPQAVILLLKYTKAQPELKMLPFVEVTAFIGAALFGQHEILSILLERGAHIDQTTSTAKLTALMIAACMNELLVVKKLLEWGADPNMVNICHRTALEMAAVSGQYGAQTFLKEMTAAPTCCISGDVDSLQRMLKSSVCSNVSTSSQNKFKITPLMQASILGSKDAILLLLKHCPDIDWQEPSKGFTALMFAIYHNKTEIVSILLHAGASVEIQAHGGVTAIDFAWIHSDGAIVQLLLSKRRKKKNRSPKLEVDGEPDPSQIWRSSKTGTLRKDSFRNLVDNLSARFQSFRKRSTSHLPAFVATQSTTPEYIDSDEGTVFANSQDSVNSHCSSKSGTSNGIRLLKLATPQFGSHDKEGHEVVSPPKFTTLIKTLNTSDYDQTLLKSGLNSKKPSFTDAFIPNALIRKIQLKLKNAKVSGNPEIANEIKEIPSTIQDQCKDETQQSVFDTQGPLKLDYPVSTSPSVSVKNILENLSIQEYIAIFQENEVDFETFKTLTEEDMHEMGILHPEHCQKILNYISSL